MKNFQTLNARSIWYWDAAEINPRGLKFSEILVPALKDKYAFREFPASLEQMKLNEGLKFTSGEFLVQSGSGMEIHLTVFDSLLFADNRVSTELSDAFLSDLMIELRRIFGAKKDVPTIRRRRYVSSVSVSFDRPLSLINPNLAALTDFLSEEVHASEPSFQPVRFEHTDITIGPDPNSTDKPGVFKIEPRVGTALDDLIYFSSAPLKTEKHIEFLSRFEEALSGSPTVGKRSKRK